MKTQLILESDLAVLADRLPSFIPEEPGAVWVHGVPEGSRLSSMEAVLTAPLPCLLEVPKGASPEDFLIGVEEWPEHLSLLVWGMPDDVRAWCRKVHEIPAATAADDEAETGSEPPAEDGPQDEMEVADNDDGGKDDVNEAEETPPPQLPRIVAGIRARHKEPFFEMTHERDLSGFNFYVPTTAGFEGYEIILPAAEEELLSHAERMEKYDLRRWLGRFVAALENMEPVFFLVSETAINRGGKGYDIEMSAYCREKAGVRVIAHGGVATVKHVFNFERHGRGLAVVLPDEIYDGSFSLHDVRAFVDAELAKIKERGSRLSLGVLAGGTLAGGDIKGHYWDSKRPTLEDSEESDADR